MRQKKNSQRKKMVFELVKLVKKIIEKKLKKKMKIVNCAIIWDDEQN